MSFQIYFRDMRHGGEGTSVCVADSLEEFRNTTVEELKRKLIPEDQHEDTILRYRFKTLQENRTLGFYGIKHEDHIYAVRRRIPVIVKPPRDSSPVHESAAKNTKLGNYDLKPLEDDHTLGSGIKHEDESSSETASSGSSGSPIYLSSSSSEQNHIAGRSSAETERSGKRCRQDLKCAFRQTKNRKIRRIHPPKDEDEDEDKVIPRSQSMDNLLMMHQPQLEPSE